MLNTELKQNCETLQNEHFNDFSDVCIISIEILLELQTKLNRRSSEVGKRLPPPFFATKKGKNERHKLNLKLPRIAIYSTYR